MAAGSAQRVRWSDKAHKESSCSQSEHGGCEAREGDPRRTAHCISRALPAATLRITPEGREQAAQQQV